MGKTVFLGVEGSGKTTLAMALLRAFGSHKAEGWYMRPLSRDSFRFVETMPSDFLKEGFPAQTSDLHELSWQLECNNEDFGEIEILDYPGEIYRLAFLDEKDERDKEAFRQKVAANKREIDALLGAIKNAEEVFVLFSLEDAIDIKGKPRNLDAVWITYECLNTLKRLDPKPNVKLLFTQADKYRESGLDINGPMFSSLDLITRNHGDVEKMFLSVIDSHEGEFGIEKLLRSMVSAQTISLLRKRFSPEVVDDIFINGGCEIGHKLLREDKYGLGTNEREEAQHYREQIREVAHFILNANYLNLAKPLNSVTDKQLSEIVWIQDAVSKYLLEKNSTVMQHYLSKTKVNTELVDRIRLSLINKIQTNIRNAMDVKSRGNKDVFIFLFILSVLIALFILGVMLNNRN